MSEASILPKTPGTLAKIIAFCGKVLTKGWWVLILLFGLAAYFIKRRANEAKLAEGLKTQRDIERKANEQYKTLGYKNRAARAQLNKEILQSRQDWTVKKKEIEDALTTDRDARAKLWDRAFGDPAPVRVEHVEGSGK